ncbi:signal recognition particle [Bradyrhizobium diazoefficiens]
MAACFMSVSALAGSMDSMNLANQLGSIIASEKACGLTYDQGAIAAFIEERVPANDMSFPSTLNMMVKGNEVQIEGMSPSAKTAHCTQVRRVAKSYGFVK